MKLKNKRRIFKTLILFVFLTIVTIPFLDWNKKNKIHRNFNDLEFRVLMNVPNNDTINNDTIPMYCDSVNIYLKNYPLDNEKIINCENIDSRIFIDKVFQIRDEYRKKDRNSNRLMFLVLIVSQILLYFSRKFVDKRFKDIDKFNE